MFGTLLIVFGLPLLAVVASFVAQNRTTRRLLRYGGAYFLIAFLATTLLSRYCGFSEHGFSSCDLFAAWFLDALSVWHLLNLFFLYLILAPVLLLVALILEIRTRRSGIEP